jgi:hypothetical protein
LEIEPAQDTREDRFLVLLEATSKSQSQPVASERIPSDARTVALSIQDPGEPIVVALPLGLESLDGLWYDYDPQGFLPDDPGAPDGENWALHVADGLDPGAYVVFLEPTDGGRSEKVFEGRTTEDGMLVYRWSGAGRFRVFQDGLNVGRAPGAGLVLTAGGR